MSRVIPPLESSYGDRLILFRTFWKKVGLYLALSLAIIAPIVFTESWLSVTNHAIIYAISAIGLMVLTGFTGQISLGQAAFMAVGAYCAATFARISHFPFFITIPLAGIAAAILGALTGPFALRLKGLYLAIVTLGLIYIVNHLLLAFHEVTGGVAGTSVPLYGWFPQSSEVSVAGTLSSTSKFGSFEINFEVKLYFISLGVLLLTLFLTKNLLRAPLGRAMMAVRDQDIAASTMGINPSQTKIIAFIISSGITGVSGALYAYHQQFITIDPPFNLQMSIEVIAMIVFGGIGTLFGAVAGAFAFTILSKLLSNLAGSIGILSSLTNDQQSVLLFSILVGLTLIYEPLGLFGVWLRIKRFFLTWPFQR
jgi:branched-chain amino acid transport system permease protein